MDAKAKELLRSFQCDYNRRLEESFAQTLAENENARLFFINENRAFTDGKMIVVDPADNGLFCDTMAIWKTERYLNWPAGILEDEWNVLRMVTRAQTIHECLHLLYTEFPGRHISDPRLDTQNKKKVCGLISNIIEDAYIEAVGCSYFDNMEMYLQFGRVSRLFAHHPGADTVTQFFEKTNKSRKNKKLQAARERAPQEPEKPVAMQEGRDDIARLMDYISYMITYLLYPMVRQGPPAPDIAAYVEPSRELMRRGSMASQPAQRYQYALQCFSLIEHLVPDDSMPLGIGDDIEKLLGGTKTHQCNSSPGGGESTGKTQAVSGGLFMDGEGNPRAKKISIRELKEAMEQFARERKEAEGEEGDNQGSLEVYLGKAYDCAVLHNKIKINEKRPAIKPGLHTKYQTILNRYKSHIRSYCSKFDQLLQARTTVREEKLLYGGGITSARLGDMKKRYWHRDIQGEDVPDLAVLLLIDGSGSMGIDKRWRAVMHSALILHEVLQRKDIPHAIVEHRAGYTEPEIDANILVGFQGRPQEKYNLMQITCDGDNRDGLALFWAERYLQRNTQNDYRLIIVLSDGLPAHKYDNYYPPVSTQDTANAVRKISKRGTHIVGVALDKKGEYDCYENLTPIYPNLVACNDLTRLTGQLLSIITKIL